jgi:general secretion pathway protein A
MYTAFYGFRQKPFNLVPDPSFLYLSPKHRMALTHLEYGLMDRIGFILLTGEIGTGKTTIVKQFLNQIGADTEVAVIFNTNVTPHQLLALILNEFGVETPGQGKPGLLDALNQFLIDKYSSGRRVLLIVDEAQNLSEEGLEEIRMLSNLQTDKEALLQILLVGQPALRVKLQRPSLEQLSQRIAVSCHIAPLNLEETRAYIAYRLDKAGAPDGQIFTPEAVTRIFEHSGGTPRVINMLCDGALVYGYADDLKTIDEALINQLVQDRQELGVMMPSPGERQTLSGGENGSGHETVLNRLGNIEARVAQLAAMFERLLQNHEGKNEKDDILIRRLETQLAEERRRFDELLAQCNSLRGQLESTGSGAKTIEAQPKAEDSAGLIEGFDSVPAKHRSSGNWAQRVGGFVKKWFIL